MMKSKLHYIFYLIAITLFFTACSEHDFLTDYNIVQSNGKPVDINGSLNTPDLQVMSTRSLGETPDIKKLYAIVFDNNGLLMEVDTCKAANSNGDNINNFSTASNGLTYFHVTLHTSTTPRIVHLVANFNPTFTTILDEASLMRKMIVTDSTDSYWQRIVFDEGIYMNSDGTVDVEKTLPKMQNLKLIRNFAKVTVSIADSIKNIFIPQGYYVFNQPKSGTVAPYNVNTAISDDPLTSRFADYIASDGTTMSYKELLDQKYYGYEPETRTFKDNPDPTSASFPWKNVLEPTYIYESTHRNDLDNPYIIIKGTYISGTGSTGVPTYYKADFCYPTEQTGSTDLTSMTYYNLIRNFQYNLKVTRISGNGSKTLADAIVGGPMNNFMGVTTAGNITNIANDISRLYVSFTDEMFTTKDPIVIKYKNVFNMHDPSTTSDDEICNLRRRELNTTDYTGKNYVRIVGLDEEDKSPIGTIKGPIAASATISSGNDANGWRTITIQPTDLPTSSLEQKIQTISIYNSDGLERNINLYYRQPMNFSVELNPATVTSSEDQEVDVIIGIPGDLTAPRFPLTFKIEHNSNAIYPNVQATGFNELPVVVGKSIIDGTTDSYYYTRNISWNEYKNTGTSNDGLKRFHCYFKTYKANSTGKIYVTTDKYFITQPITATLANN
ncbi:hypothetical protein prwr041_26100 [Prevotella herbatica]|uniref:Major fimbrial subunit protein N-terminal domain-containing protein n=1 Tax=Prevotella herbatica TaxID=2801997 RepID=A0ABM7P1Q3_9BACT|nr:hypothetical protein [Prevotella herbatica]BCS86717.1 hypothetical protein prwr041_26100 [Prevotella herbatica]